MLISTPFFFPSVTGVVVAVGCSQVQDALEGDADQDDFREPVFRRIPLSAANAARGALLLVLAPSTARHTVLISLDWDRAMSTSRVTYSVTMAEFARIPRTCCHISRHACNGAEGRRRWLGNSFANVIAVLASCEDTVALAVWKSALPWK